MLQVQEQLQTKRLARLSITVAAPLVRLPPQRRVEPCSGMADVVQTRTVFVCSASHVI